MTNDVAGNRDCIRCDQPGLPDGEDMLPLFQVLDAEDSAMWVHRKCLTAHRQAAFAADLASPAAVAADQTVRAWSGPMVDLERARLTSSLRDAALGVSENLRRVEAMRTELERRGMDPDMDPDRTS